ncbi:Phosphoglucosamine mutase [Dissostichus eleginoides]|uniref:Phosphoglucosamine mutase n=1 Tax=Dissostichus eleginoides TaxID=100907 RepID=A0AAD9C1X5_DISEL|nr:Phosphoglucosamine mutase [Dissostichus eleginoides]
MGKLSERRQGARINIPPSTQVQCEIDESAACRGLIVFPINSTPNLIITLYIIMHFCATVHLFKHTPGTETDHDIVHLLLEFE